MGCRVVLDDLKPDAARWARHSADVRFDLRRGLDDDRPIRTKALGEERELPLRSFEFLVFAFVLATLRSCSDHTLNVRIRTIESSPRS